MKVIKIQGLWAIVDQNNEIVEAYDTKYEALDDLWKMKFDKNHAWISMWDVENRKRDF